MSEVRDAALQVLLDKDAIRDVLYRYCRAVDRWDWELLRSVYHPDSFDDHGWICRGSGSEFTDIMQQRMADGAMDFSQHAILNILIDVDGDTARSEAYYTSKTGRRDQPALTSAGGRYIDRFEKRHGEWRIAQRVTTVEWLAKVEQDWSEAANGPNGFVAGRHDRNDPVYQGDLPRRPATVGATP